MRAIIHYLVLFLRWIVFLVHSIQYSSPSAVRYMAPEHELYAPKSDRIISLMREPHDAYKSSFAHETQLLSRRAICQGCREDTFLEDLHYCTNCDYGAPKTPQQRHSQRYSQESPRSSQEEITSKTTTLAFNPKYTFDRRIAKGRSRIWAPEQELERQRQKSKRYRQRNAERLSERAKQQRRKQAKLSSKRSRKVGKGQ